MGRGNEARGGRYRRVREVDFWRTLCVCSLICDLAARWYPASKRSVRSTMPQRRCASLRASAGSGFSRRSRSRPAQATCLIHSVRGSRSSWRTRRGSVTLSCCNTSLSLSVRTALRYAVAFCPPPCCGPDGLNVGQQILTSTLEAYGAPGGHSAMALTVGVPCGIATQLVLDGVISTPGVLVPYTKEICDPLREQLEKEGIGMVERVL